MRLLHCTTSISTTGISTAGTTVQYY